MKKSLLKNGNHFIIENIDFDRDKLSDKLIEEIEFKIFNLLGVVYIEGKNIQEIELNMWELVENYLQFKITTLEYTINKPHKFTAYL